MSLLGEYAADSVNRYVVVGKRVEPIPELDDIVLGNLGLSAGIAGRFAIETTIPLFLAASGRSGSGGPRVGDIQVAAPIRIADFVGVVPFFHLPTGDAFRYLGDLGPGGGGLVSLGFRPGNFAITGNVGVDFRTKTFGVATVGGPLLRSALTVGYVFSDRLGVHLETTNSTGLLVDVEGRQIPTEGLLSVRGHPKGALHWSTGAGSALTGSFSAASLRVFAGVGGHWGPTVEPDPIIVVDPPEIGPVDGPVAEPVPVLVRVNDARGNPLAARVSAADQVAVGVPGRYTLALTEGSHEVVVVADQYGEQARTVVVGARRVAAIEVEATLLGVTGTETVAVNLADLDGVPVEGGQVLVDGLPVGTTSTGGDVLIAGLSIGEHEVAVRAHGYRSLAEVATGVFNLALLPVEGSLRVRVTDGQGPVEDAYVSFSGESYRPAVLVGSTGERVFVLSPGSWEAVVTSEDHGMQSRAVVLERDAYTVAEAEFLLQPPEDGEANLTVIIADPAGEPVGDALITVDGLPYGATSTGGSLTLNELLVGERTIGLMAENTVAVPVRRVVLYPGMQEQIFSVDWLPGSVRMGVRSPDGPVSDAVVVPSGPVVAKPLALGPTGVGIRQLAAGDWELLVSSALWGTQVRHVSVSEAAGALVDVDVVLFASTASGDLANLRVAVTDPARIAVPGASIRLDEVDHGGTASGGILEVSGLALGPRQLEIVAPALAAAGQRVELVAGDQTVEVQLGWGVGAVRVTATSVEGPVIDGVLRVVRDGDATRPLGLDLEGRRIVSLDPGSWQAVVISETQGIASATFDVPETSERTEVEIHMADTPGDMLLVVRDPGGRPVVGVEIGCEGCRASAAAGGFLYVSGTENGLVATVSAPGFVDAEIDVPAGIFERIVQLDPALSPVRVTAVDPEGTPLDAEIRLEGPYRVPSAKLGADGQETVSLAAGLWTLTGVAEGFGAQRKQVRVPPSETVLDVSLAFSTGNVQVTADEVVIGEQVHFDVGQAVLRADSGDILEQVADALIANPRVVSVEIGGHTDSRGDVALNLKLSEERAAAVREALIQLGVAPSRLIDRGYGPTRPVSSNDEEEGRQRNRRVQFDIQEVSDAD